MENLSSRPGDFRRYVPTTMTAIAPDIFADIQQRLVRIERDHNVRVLYACESGSRAWGFESLDSDYDVRFIYVRSRDWYLAIDVERKRDVIEVPINDLLDISGWDIRKTLHLFLKTNPPLNEWLVSPIVYAEHGDFATRLRDIAPAAYNPIAAHYHYLRMAQTTFRSHLKGDSIRRKKYLYVLRPLLAVNWLEAEKGVVPIEFDRLVEGTITDGSLLSAISELLEIKRSGNEKDQGPRLPFIHEYIESEMARHGDAHSHTPGSHADIDLLNDLFRSTVEVDSPISQFGT